MPQKFKPVFFLSLIMIGLLFIFRRFIFGPDLYIFNDIGTDTIMLFYPRMVEFMEYIKSEGMPLWSFFRGIGQPMYGAKVVDPFSLIVVLFDPNQIAHSIIYIQLAKIALSVFICYKYLQMLSLNSKTVGLGTTLFAFAGYLLGSSSWYGHTTFVLQFILVMYAIELLLQKKVWWPLSLAILYMFGTKMYFIFEFSLIYSILRLIETDSFSKKGIQEFVFNGFKSVGLGILLIAPFVGSLIYKLLYSPRVGGEVSKVDSLSSTPAFELVSNTEIWSSILSTFANDILGNGSAYQGFNNYLERPTLYIGIICLLMLPQVFVKLKKSLIITYSVILGLWVIILVFPYFRYAFYAFAGNYYKSGISLFIPFTMLYFALKGLNRFFEKGQLNSIVLLGTSAVLLTLLYFPTQLHQAVSTEIRIVCTVFIVLYTLILALGRKWHTNPYFFLLLFALIFCEGLYNGNNTMKDRVAFTKAEFDERKGLNDYTREAIQYINENSDPFYRVEKMYGSSTKSGYNDSHVQGFFGSKTYDSHNHKNYIAFLREMDLLGGTSEDLTRWTVGLVSAYYIHGLFSIKYLLTTPSTDEYVWQSSVNNLGVMNGITVYENKHYIPLGIPFDTYIPKSAFNRFQTKEEKHMSLYHGVILEDSEVDLTSRLTQYTEEIRDINSIRFLSRNLAKNAMKMESFSHNKIKGSIQLEKESLVFYSIPYDEGWSVKVDGKHVKTYKVNIGMMGILLPPGSHQIQLNYRPPFYTVGWILFWIGLLLLGYSIHKTKKKPIETETLSDAKIAVETKAKTEVTKKKKVKKKKA